MVGITRSKVISFWGCNQACSHRVFRARRKLAVPTNIPTSQGQIPTTPKHVGPPFPYYSWTPLPFKKPYKKYGNGMGPLMGSLWVPRVWGPLGKSQNYGDHLLISEVGAEFRSTGLVNLSGGGPLKAPCPHVREASN